jgi:hypothetical protein
MSETAETGVENKPPRIIDEALLNDLEMERRRARWAAESARAKVDSAALDAKDAERKAASLDYIHQQMTARRGQVLEDVMAEFEAEAARLDALVPELDADVERKKQIVRDWEGYRRIIRQRRKEALADPEVGDVTETWEITRRERAYLIDAVMVYMKHVERVPENDGSELPELQQLLDRLMHAVSGKPEAD